MNIFIAVVSLTLAVLIHFGAIHLAKDETAIKLSLILLSGIFFLRSELEDLREHVMNHNDNDEQAPPSKPRLRS